MGAPHNQLPVFGFFRTMLHCNMDFPGPYWRIAPGRFIIVIHRLILGCPNNSTHFLCGPDPFAGDQFG